MKLLLAIFLLLPTFAHADVHMEEYKKKVLRRDEVYKGPTSDLKDEMKGEIETNPLEERTEPVQAQELPPPTAPQAPNQPQMMPPQGAPQLPPNMSLQDAAAMGRQLRDQQKSQPAGK
jgi:hypothetical protein